MPNISSVSLGWKPILRLLVFGLILWFWGRVLVENRQSLVQISWQISWRLLLFSLVLLMVQIVLLGIIWWRGLILVGGHLRLLRGVAIWLQTQMARYLPGGVWDMAGRLALSREHRVDTVAVSASLGLEIGLQVVSAGLYLVIALLLRTGEDAEHFLPIVLTLIPATLLLLAPPIFQRLLNLALAFVKRPPIDLDLSISDLFLLFLARVVAHGLLGVGFLLFVQGLSAVDPALVPLLIAAYIGAWLIGFLALPVPTGIGVREGVLLFLLGDVMPVGVVTAAALGYRFWLTGRDLLAGLLGLWLSRRADQGEREAR